MNDDVLVRVKRIVSQVLNVPQEDVGLDTDQSSTLAWDSLHHVHLLTALEEEFKVPVDADQLLELTNVRAIVAYFSAAR
jgi:acyl carrier protein